MDEAAAGVHSRRLAGERNECLLQGLAATAAHESEFSLTFAVEGCFRD